MTFTIGSGPREQAKTLVERLLDCHRRIRDTAELAIKVAAAGDRPDQIPEAAAKVARYFEQALPRHVADENETIAPRLRGREPELDVALAAMEAEHAEHDEPIGHVIALCRMLESDPGLIQGMSRFYPLAIELRDGLVAHLEAEEAVIFPAIERLLDADEQAVMIAELAARRDKRS